MVANHLAETVEALNERIAALVQERQALRAVSADVAELERNRIEIARLQQRLSLALIDRHARTA